MSIALSWDRPSRSWPCNFLGLRLLLLTLSSVTGHERLAGSILFALISHGVGGFLAFLY